jgi:nucleoid DNA-binding protein
VNQSEFVKELGLRLSQDRGIPTRHVQLTIEAALDLITETLADGGEVAFLGFGAFSNQDRAARLGVNPRNPKERIATAARRVPKFSPGSRLKESVAEGRAVPLQGRKSL